MALYYSCDSHVVEPPEVFAGLDKEFGTRAPYYVQDPPGKKGTYIVLARIIHKSCAKGLESPF